MIHKKLRQSHYFYPVTALLVFLLAVVIEQSVSYYRLCAQIGKPAYSSVYALYVIGKYDQYIGRVVEVKWNALPDHEEDLVGIQPRMLIARETVEGATETRWYSSYLFNIKEQPPKKFKPSPFPPFQKLELNP